MKYFEKIKHVLVLVLPHLRFAIFIPVGFALIYLFLQAAENRSLANELRRVKETLSQKEFELGVFQSSQVVVDDLREQVMTQLSDIMEGNAELKKELRKATIHQTTTVTVRPETDGVVTTEREPITPGIRSFFASDRFVRFNFSSAGEVSDIEHAPINLSIIDTEKDGIRKQLAVVTGGWDNAPIKDVEIHRMLSPENVFKPYFSAELFAGTKYSDFIAKRHVNPWLAYGVGVGYNYEQKELSYGMAMSLNLIWRRQ